MLLCLPRREDSVEHFPQLERRPLCEEADQSSGSCYGEVAYIGYRRAARRGEAGTQDDIEDSGQPRSKERTDDVPRHPTRD